MIETNDEQKRLIELALPILQGLLASGKYLDPEDDSEVTRIQRIDNGPEWKKDGFPRRFTALAVEHAVGLADELIDYVKWSAPDDPGPIYTATKPLTDVEGENFDQDPR